MNRILTNIAACFGVAAVLGLATTFIAEEDRKRKYELHKDTAFVFYGIDSSLGQRIDSIKFNGGTIIP